MTTPYARAGNLTRTHVVEAAVQVPPNTNNIPPDPATITQQQAQRPGDETSITRTGSHGGNCFARGIKKVLMWNMNIPRLPPLSFWVVVVLGWFFAAWLYWKEWFNTTGGGAPMHRWFFFIGIQIAAWVFFIASVGNALIFLKHRFFYTPWFYYVNSIGRSIVAIFCVTFTLGIYQLMLGPNLDGEFRYWIRRVFLAALLIALANVFLVILTKYAICHVTRDRYWAKVSAALFKEHLLQKMRDPVYGNRVIKHRNKMRKQGDLQHNVPIVTDPNAKPDMNEYNVMAGAARVNSLFAAVAHRYKKDPNVVPTKLEIEDASEVFTKQIIDNLGPSPFVEPPATTPGAPDPTPTPTLDGDVPASPVPAPVSDPVVLHRDELREFVKKKSEMRDAMNFLDKNGNGYITASELKEAVKQTMTQRAFLQSSLNDREDIALALSFLVDIAFYILVSLAILITLGLQPVVLLTTYGTSLLAVSFIFGNSVRRIFESFTMVFFMRNFDVGDAISFDQGKTVMVIDKFQLLSTIAYTGEGKQYVIPNHTMLDVQIMCLKGDRDRAIGTSLDVEFKTSSEKIAELKTRLHEWIVTQPKTFNPSWSMNIDEVSPTKRAVTLGFWFPLVNISFSNGAEFNNARNTLLLQIKKVATELDIQYHMPMQRVIVDKDSIYTKTAEWM